MTARHDSSTVASSCMALLGLLGGLAACSASTPRPTSDPGRDEAQSSSPTAPPRASAAPSASSRLRSCKRAPAEGPAELGIIGRLDDPEPAVPLQVRLAPQRIQQVVRASFDQARKCYEDGLRRDPTLHGSIKERFIIELDGSVSCTDASGSTIPDPRVVGCVSDLFDAMHFPAPVGGIVTVVYPINFSPGDEASGSASAKAAPSGSVR